MSQERRVSKREPTTECFPVVSVAVKTATMAQQVNNRSALLSFGHSVGRPNNFSFPKRNYIADCHRHVYQINAAAAAAVTGGGGR